MRFLLDTNVISESARPSPNPGVVAWLERQPHETTFLSAATWAELRRGAARLQPGARRQQLERWLERDLPLRFWDRILTLDLPVADAWGRLVARRECVGRPIHPMDAWIAATAEAHQLTLVTRDQEDFRDCGVPVLNPWT